MRSLRGIFLPFESLIEYFSYILENASSPLSLFKQEICPQATIQARAPC
jgi:hypothetical protein